MGASNRPHRLFRNDNAGALIRQFRYLSILDGIGAVMGAEYTVAPIYTPSGNWAVGKGTVASSTTKDWIWRNVSDHMEIWGVTAFVLRTSWGISEHGSPVEINLPQISNFLRMRTARRVQDSHAGRGVNLHRNSL